MMYFTVAQIYEACYRIPAKIANKHIWHQILQQGYCSASFCKLCVVLFSYVKLMAVCQFDMSCR